MELLAGKSKRPAPPAIDVVAEKSPEETEDEDDGAETPVATLDDEAPLASAASSDPAPAAAAAPAASAPAPAPQVSSRSVRQIKEVVPVSQHKGANGKGMAKRHVGQMKRMQTRGVTWAMVRKFQLKGTLPVARPRAHRKADRGKAIPMALSRKCLPVFKFWLETTARVLMERVVLYSTAVRDAKTVTEHDLRAAALQLWNKLYL